MDRILELIGTAFSVSDSTLALLVGLAAIVLAGYAIHAVRTATRSGDKR